MYLGQSVIYARECNQCPLDTLVTGLEVVEMDLSGAQPSLTVVPGTYGASSAALSTTRDTLYYTLINDSRVYRLALPSAQLSIAHDFGARRDRARRDGARRAPRGGRRRRGPCTSTTRSSARSSPTAAAH